MMKTKKTVIISLTAMSIISIGSAFAMGQGMGQGSGQGNGRDVERPENFMEMNQEERQAFMQSQNRLEDFDSMTEDEREAFQAERQAERGGDGEKQMKQNRNSNGNGQENAQGSFRSEDFNNMTDDEREAFREERQAERGGNGNNDGEGQMNKNQKRFNNNARKAENYKGFQKQLKQKKNFKDSNQIENQEAVGFLQQRGILDGYADGSFRPQNPINRAESVKVLLEALGETPDAVDVVADEFDDVPKDAWFAGYVNKAKRKGIIKGYDDGTFKPDKTVNQAELLKIAFESFGIDLTNYPVTTVDDSSAWYAPYLQYAIDNDLIDGDVNLGEGMTREAFSEVIYRLIQQQENL